MMTEGKTIWRILCCFSKHSTQFIQISISISCVGNIITPRIAYILMRKTALSRFQNYASDVGRSIIKIETKETSREIIHKHFTNENTAGNSF